MPSVVLTLLTCLPRLESGVLAACKTERVMKSIAACKTGKETRVRAFLALACAAVRCAEYSIVPSRSSRTGLTERLATQLLHVVAEAIAAHAADLARRGLEVACTLSYRTQ